MIAPLKRAVFARNPVAWFETHGRLQNAKLGVGSSDKDSSSGPDLPPCANEMQRQVGEAVAWCLARRVPVRLIQYKPRQKGCSTINVAAGYVLSRSAPVNGLIIGAQASQTGNLWKMLRHYGARDTFDWGHRWHATHQAAACGNGSTWQRETAGDREAGRSGTYHVVIATEVARWPSHGVLNAADVLNSVLNCVPDEPGTAVILESTAAGPVGVFPETWAGAVTLDQMRQGVTGNGYIKIFTPWHRFGDSARPLPHRKDSSWLRGHLAHVRDTKAIQVWEQHRLSPEQAHWYHHKLKAPECGGDPAKRDREYPTTPDDGFRASAPSRFSIPALDWLDDNARHRRHLVGHGTLRLPADQALLPSHMRRYHEVSWSPCPFDQAEIAIIEHPRPGCAYILATDNMKGGSHVTGADPDTNAVQVLRRGHLDPAGRWIPPEVVASLIPSGWGNPDIKSPGNRWDMDLLAELVARLSGYYGGCMVAPESNRGEHLIKELRNRNVQLWRRQRPHDRIDSFQDSGLIGFETTAEMKKSLVENLAAAIREPDQPGAGLRIAFPWILQQLRTFVRHKDGSEGALRIAGCHDDEVIALAIALLTQSAATHYHRPQSATARPWDLSDDRVRSEVW